MSEAWVKDDGFEAFQANGNREVYALEELTPTRGYSTSVPEGSGILAFIAPWIGYHASSRLKDSTAHKAVLSRSPRCSPRIELNCAGLVQG